MGTYVNIRGWFDVTRDNDFHRLTVLLSAIQKERISPGLAGCCWPEWPSLTVFFGGNIRIEYVKDFDFVLESCVAMGFSINGYFHLSGPDDSTTWSYKIKGDKIEKSLTNDIFLYDLDDFSDPAY